MEIIPAVDVLDGQVVRLRQGSFERATRYEADPVAAAVRWVEEGASLVHVVDLDGARHGQPDERLWQALGAWQVPFQVGGGIRRAEIARQALAAGARRVVMGSAALWDPGQLAAVGDRERVVAALDIARGKAHGEGWLGQGRPWEEVLARLVELGLPRILVTGISRDGTMAGPDVELLEAVRSVFPALSVLASGGVGSLDDVRRLAAMGFEAAIVGRALYEGRFTLEAAREAGA